MPEWSAQLQERATSDALLLPQQRGDAAAKFGTGLHDLIDARLAATLPPLPSEPEPEPEPEPEAADEAAVDERFGVGLRNFERWRSACGYEFLCNDFFVWSERYKYAGAADALAYTSGDGAGSKAGLVVIDFKSSNAIQRSYALQAAAYARAVEEMTGEPVVRAAVVRLGKTKERRAPLPPLRCVLSARRPVLRNSFRLVCLCSMEAIDHCNT